MNYKKGERITVENGKVKLTTKPMTKKTNFFQTGKIKHLKGKTTCSEPKHDTKLCKCGNPMPIAPYYCKTCKMGSMKGMKLEVVEIMKKTNNLDKFNEDWERDLAHTASSVKPYLEASLEQRERIKTYILNREKALKNTPMGVSAWRNLGRKYGYDKYFQKALLKEITYKIKEVNTSTEAGTFKDGHDSLKAQILYYLKNL